MNKIVNYVSLLIKNNTGVSSKNFFLVTVTAIGSLLLLVPAVILLVEVYFNHTITTDLNGLAAYIAAVASLFASAGITKAWSERNEAKNSSSSPASPSPSSSSSSTASPESQKNPQKGASSSSSSQA